VPQRALLARTRGIRVQTRTDGLVTYNPTPTRVERCLLARAVSEFRHGQMGWSHTIRLRPAGNSQQRFIPRLGSATNRRPFESDEACAVRAWHAHCTEPTLNQTRKKSEFVAAKEYTASIKRRPAGEVQQCRPQLIFFLLRSHDRSIDPSAGRLVVNGLRRDRPLAGALAA
jgi:hypothetical protein